MDEEHDSDKDYQDNLVINLKSYGMNADEALKIAKQKTKDRRASISSLTVD